MKGPLGSRKSQRAIEGKNRPSPTHELKYHHSTNNEKKINVDKHTANLSSPEGIKYPHPLTFCTLKLCTTPALGMWQTQDICSQGFADKGVGIIPHISTKLLPVYPHCHWTHSCSYTLMYLNPTGLNCAGNSQ